VEKDGSGDFTVIQDAVNAAAPGDTVAIGPGRYTEREMVQTPGWTAPVYVLIQQEELTLIGSGGGWAIIGQEEPWDVSQPSTRGIEAGPWWGSTKVHVVDIRFENIAFAVGGNPAPDYEIRGCEFVGNNWGVIAVDAAHLDVEGSEFSQIAHTGRLLYTAGCMSTSIDGCTFTLVGDEFWSRQEVQITGAQTVRVANAEFSGGGHGLEIIGSTSEVHDCTFNSHRYDGLIINGADADVRDCAFADVGYAVLLSGLEADIAINNIVVSGVSYGTIGFDGVGSLAVNNSILDRGEHGVVKQTIGCDETVSDLPRLDMTNNDWGTTEVDRIAAWIHVCDYAVDFIPFVGQSVPTEVHSWSALKGLFDGGGPD
jgi:hypothetical protein